MRLILLTALATVWLIGCSSSNHSEVIVPTDAAAASGEEVAHPEFAHWSKFPIGSKTVRRKEVSNDQGKVVVTTTVKLVEKNERQVVVETQVTVERSGDPKLENPPFTADYPATFQLPKNMKLEQFSLPSLKAKLEGEEELDILGKKIKTEKFVWQESNEAGPMELSLWRSDDIPGRTVREESLTKSLSNKSLEEVIEVHIPEPATPK